MKPRKFDFNAGRAAAAFEPAEEDANPNSYLTNLSDCMLVLALGLMLALVVAWNAQVPNMTEVKTTDNMTEVTDLDKMTDPNSAEGTGYVDMGTVWQDPKTGRMYLIEEADSSEGDSGDSGDAGEDSSGSSTGGEITNSQTSANSLGMRQQSGSSTSDQGSGSNG